MYVSIYTCIYIYIYITYLYYIIHIYIYIYRMCLWLSTYVYVYIYIYIYIYIHIIYIYAHICVWTQTPQKASLEPEIQDQSDQRMFTHLQLLLIIANIARLRLLGVANSFPGRPTDHLDLLQGAGRELRRPRRWWPVGFLRMPC